MLALRMNCFCAEVTRYSISLSQCMDVNRCMKGLTQETDHTSVNILDVAKPLQQVLLCRLAPPAC